jgi:DNA-binding transcriptional LysR family regulator
MERREHSHLHQVESPPAITIGIEFRELRSFTVLCEELHFGRAAERLHISQSPLSQTIAQLERKLGARLLDRSSRHVRLTPSGEVLLEHARRLLHELDDAVGAAQRAAAGETGSVRLAVGPIARAAVLPALRHELDLLHPSLHVEVDDGSGDAMIDGLMQGAMDVVLMLCPPHRDGTDHKVLRRDRPIAVVHYDNPLAQLQSVTLQELAAHTLVLSPRPFARGVHDVILTMFHGHAPASTRIADLNSGAFWDAMRAESFAVLPSSAPFSGDFVALAIEDATAEFVLSMVWSTRTPPSMLPGLIEAADAAIAANGWL